MIASETLQSAVNALIDDLGSGLAARALGMSEEAMLKLARGLPVRQMTISLATMKLASLGKLPKEGPAT